MGCSSWGREESDTTEQLHFHFSLSCTGEGNGNPLQYSCLENPRDGEAADYNPLGSSCPWNIPGKTTVVGCSLLLQGIFLTQGDHTHVTCVQIEVKFGSHWTLSLLQQDINDQNLSLHFSLYLYFLECSCLFIYIFGCTGSSLLPLGFL